MVNIVAAQKPLIKGLMKMLGIRPYTVEIESGTIMNFWLPSETISKPKKKEEKPKIIAKPNKPVVVLVHGFAAEGIMTWQFQIGALTKKYSVYVPDLLFFGDSVTDKTERSPRFQAECLATALRKLGVEKCILVGFSYGGMVAFKMGELYPELVEAMVISGSIVAMTNSISVSCLQELGFSSFSELLLPNSIRGVKSLLSIGAYKKLWFPDRFYKDFLEKLVEIMVNLVAAQKPLIKGLMKMAGIRPYTVEIESGTIMSFWLPSETISKPKKKEEKPKIIAKPNKPVVVLIHGFAAEGIVTWQFQIGALTKKYSVYVPDLLFFGDSVTDKTERSPKFQAECLATALRKLGVEKCILVGFSYGGMVAFKMGEMYPELVEAIVISGSILSMTDSISVSSLQELGFSSSSELLLPNSVKGLKALLSVAAYKKLWFPDRLHKDFLEVMFGNRKERGELLEGLVISNKDIHIPTFPQRIHLLWGENDQIFKLELAQNMKEQLGDGTTFEGIKKAGHLVHLERPCVYNRCLKHFIASFLASNQPK